MTSSLSFFFDIIVIAASGCAGVYCWLLNKRLKALKDSTQGIGAIIREMAVAVTKSQEAVDRIRKETNRARKGLQDLLDEAQETTAQLSTALHYQPRYDSSEKIPSADTPVTKNDHISQVHHTPDILPATHAYDDQHTGDSEQAPSAKFDYYRKKLEEITKNKAKALQEREEQAKQRTFKRIVNRIKA